MSRINPEGQLTRQERLVTVLAICGALLVHAVVLFGWGRIARWAQEEQKKERLMVIRRVRDFEPPRDTIPEPPRQRPGPAGTEGRLGSGEKAAPPPPPDPQVRESGPEPPRETELSPAMEQELRDLQSAPTDLGKGLEQSENSVSVVTDLKAASFSVGGPADYRGSGTFWVHRGSPPGTYTVTFNPVAGFVTPAVQTKDLPAQGHVIFIGKYRRSVEIVVDSNEPGAQVTIYRPDGRPLELTRPGRALLEDLPGGTYTAVFKDVPGHVTPPPISRTLDSGGKLSFFGDYRDAPAASAGGEAATGGEGTGTGAKGAGRGSGGGYGRGSGSGGGSSRGQGRGKPPVEAPAEARDADLDRRVQLVVHSYPRSRNDDNRTPIPYPGVIIRKSNFQQGWCQVYLVLQISDRGEVERVMVERPRPDERPRYEALIQAVESAVRNWDYDRVKSEVHVDVRFYVE